MTVNMLDGPTLKEATVQELHWELIRRSNYNAFDGRKACAFLERHRALWESVILDRLGFSTGKDDETGSDWGLIKLRDLAGNHWNADTLIVLTPGRAAAEELARLIGESDLGADCVTVESEEQTGRALGVMPCSQGLVSAWWD